MLAVFRPFRPVLLPTVDNFEEEYGYYELLKLIDMNTGARIAHSFFVALLLLCAITTANPEILTAHNVYRDEVGVDRLTYNDTLAASAQDWAEHDASIGSMVHSDPKGKYGENIAVWSTGWASWTDIVNLWGSEKTFFIYGPLGDGSSTTGDVSDIGHYTQIVWSSTTQCGCGKATNSTQNADYFVCQYSPPGNYLGQYPYPEIVLASDTIGLFRPSTSKWYLDYDNNGLSDYRVVWGDSTDIPVAGDWDGDGRDEIGLFRPSTRMWYLDYDNNGLSDYRVGWGDSTDIPVAGDWDGDGRDEIGLFRPSTSKWYLDYDNNGLSDYRVVWGDITDITVSGKWS